MPAFCLQGYCKFILGGKIFLQHPVWWSSLKAYYMMHMDYIIQHLRKLGGQPRNSRMCSRHYLTYCDCFMLHLYHVKLPIFKGFPRYCSGTYCQWCRYSSPSSLQLPCLCNYLEKQPWKLLPHFGILLHLSLFWSYNPKYGIKYVCTLLLFCTSVQNFSPFNAFRDMRSHTQQPCDPLRRMCLYP